MKLEKGYIHVYTGNGKGKTTAALGLAMRSAGYGLKTYFLMFMKSFPYSEKKAIIKLSDNITLSACGHDEFVFKKEEPSTELINEISLALDNAKNAMLSGEFDIIILDEILVSIYFKLLEEEKLISFINEKPNNVELVLTGRYATETIIKLADLVTEMKEIKHYYSKGILSRNGIDC